MRNEALEYVSRRKNRPNTVLIRSDGQDFYKLVFLWAIGVLNEEQAEVVRFAVKAAMDDATDDEPGDSADDEAVN